MPFTSVTELILLELAFELIREAGVRVPGALGNAIGIVGGLIIGDAAVSANLVSPIVVMIVAVSYTHLSVQVYAVFMAVVLPVLLQLSFRKKSRIIM